MTDKMTGKGEEDQPVVQCYLGRLWAKQGLCFFFLFCDCVCDLILS